MWIALPIALLSACLFATGSSLQHRSTQSVPPTAHLGLLARLARRREWLVGAGLGAAAFALHATALHLGSLTLVQPVIVTGIVFTVIIRAAIDRHRPSRGEIGWAAVTWAGLVIFVLTLRQGTARSPDPSLAVITTAVGIAVAAGIVLATRVVRVATHRGAALAAAAGVLFGLVAGLVKVSTTTVSHAGWLALLTSWPAYVLIMVGLGAVSLNQLAYRSTRLSVSTPVLNIVQLVVAITFGLVVFGEQLLDTPARVVAQLIGLAAMGLGVVQLARRSADGP